jgi:hypothetical protein
MSIIPKWFSAPDRVPSVCALHSSHVPCSPGDRQGGSRLILMRFTGPAFRQCSTRAAAFWDATCVCQELIDDMLEVVEHKH